MPRASKSQWDFGELFSPEETRRVLTVSELTAEVKRLLETHLGSPWVTGEITNFRQQGSGHCYFTLKDADTQVACVLFRGERVPHRALLEDGQKVVLQGDVTVYSTRGQYQLIVRQVELQGLGALQAAFEKLKQKLAAEGLFSEERKRPLPSHPLCIGIVTSSTAAALRDVMHVVERRNPALRIILAPCRVQGQGAAREIAESIRRLNDWNVAQTSRRGAAGTASGVCGPMQALLVTRGGGSLEDLWAFNEEVVARAIVDSALPVVSAVGHEIDFTISDFAADLRAATPSAAAEILTEGVYASRALVWEAPARLREAARATRDGLADDLRSVAGRLRRAHPQRRLQESAQRLDDLESSLVRALQGTLRQQRQQSAHLTGRLLQCKPGIAVDAARTRLDHERRRLVELARRSHQALTERVQGLQTRLQLVGPQQVLARGYTLTTDAATGRIVRAASEVVKGQRLKTQFRKDAVISTVES
jgi:exodeoxyribonuclease VII large subunit